MRHRRQVNEHDVVLLGEGLAGLVAANLLVRQNLSVLLLRERRWRPLDGRKEYRFVPFSNLSERCLKPKLLQQWSKDFNLPPSHTSPEENRPSAAPGGKPGGTDFQVILPKSRVDLFQDGSRMKREWAREFPLEADRIEKLYGHLRHFWKPLEEPGPQGGRLDAFWRWLISGLGNILSPDPPLELSLFSKEFQKYIQLQLETWGGFHARGVPLPLASYLLGHEERQGRNLRVDAEGFRQSLLDAYLREGGRLVEIDAIEKIYRGWRKGFAVLLGTESRFLRSRFLILNTPLHRAPALEGRLGKGVSSWSARITPRLIVLPLFLAVREQVIPVGMKDLLVSILDPEKPFEEGNLLLIGLSPKGDESCAPGGKRALTAMSFANVADLDGLSWESHQKEVMNHLRHLFPFLDHHVEFIDSAWAKEQFFCWSYPHFSYEAATDFRWKEGVVPTRLSRNLYFTGRENFPYLGLEGELLSGWTAARQILQKVTR